MSADDQKLLSEMILQLRDQNQPGMKADDYFEIFSAEQILKDHSLDLAADEIASGLMGQGHGKIEKGDNGRDGGIDAFYLLVNRKLIREDTDLTVFKGTQCNIEVIVIQSKNSGGFNEDAIDKMRKFVDIVLKRTAVATPESTKLYRQSLREAVSRFHLVLTSVLTSHPIVRICFYYASLGEQISDGVETHRKLLEKDLGTAFSVATPTVQLVGAKKLLKLAMQSPTKQFVLQAEKHLPFGDAYICWVRLGRFYEFIDNNGAPRLTLFESNVRDFAGDVTVNQDIAKALAAQEKEEFWWLNNGISIIASEVVASGDHISVTDPLIVNGLQTSYVIHRHFSSASKDDPRNILVRIMKTADPVSIDKIIKATNSQTRIPSVWLHSTEEIHSKIEIAMKGKDIDLFYDRRKNFYKNRGVAVSKIVTIPYLAQALIAIVLQRPDDARARPSTAAENHYQQLFPKNPNLDLYGKCAKIMRRIDSYLEGTDLERGQRLNVAFYLAMRATCYALKAARAQRSKISTIDVGVFNDDLLKECLSDILSEFPTLIDDDKLAKGPDVTQKMLEVLQKRYPTKKKVKAS